jgi:hypothetical protein
LIIDPSSQQEFSDADFRIVDNGDQSKKLAFEVSGIATGTTRTITVPNSDMSFSSAFATFLNTPSSANLAALLTDESGTAGTVPFATAGSTTPTPTATSGTFTSISCALSYIRVGNLVAWRAITTITTAGTAAGSVFIPQPFTAASLSPCGGIESAATAFALTGRVNGSSAQILKYDGTTIIGSGRVLETGGLYFV